MQRENTVVDITIDLVKEIFPGDDQTIQIFNIIFKRLFQQSLIKFNYILIKYFFSNQMLKKM